MPEPTNYSELLHSVIDANRRLLDVTGRQQNLLEAQEHAMLQKDKEIANLAEMVKKPERKLPALITKVRMGRNSSWRNSAWLGLRESILFAPTRLLEAVKTPLGASLVTVGWALAAVAVWVVAIPTKLVLGACGFLIERKESDQK